jgi:cell wall assembly regulator SMI1
VPALTAQQIAALEQQLGCVLPDDVRAKYGESDGLFGPTNCNLLYPYLSDTESQVVRLNALMKSQQWFPDWLPAVAILGDDGCGNYLCFDPAKRRALLWNPADGEWIQQEFPSMTALWAHVTKLYDSAA